MTNYNAINNLVAKHQAGDGNATTLLLTKFDNLLKQVAYKYSKKEPNLPFADLYQHGIYVFLLLCKKYKLNTGVNFVGYAKQNFEHTFTNRMCEI